MFSRPLVDCRKKEVYNWLGSWIQSTEYIKVKEHISQISRNSKGWTCTPQIICGENGFLIKFYTNHINWGNFRIQIVRVKEAKQMNEYKSI